MPETLITVNHLRKEFPKGTAIENVSFSVERGESVGLLGPNGAGKTTTMHILLGLVTRTAGEIRIFGKDPEKERIAILHRSNFCSAYIHLPKNLKVLENLKIFADIYGVKKDVAKIRQLMDLFEVSHLSNNETGKLSSGETTRVNLCKSLINDPELLILDEPTASLDPDIADKVRKLLRKIQKERGMTMIYTSHNMRDVEEACDRILFLNKGVIIANGTTAEIIEQFGQSSLEEVFIRIARHH